MLAVKDFHYFFIYSSKYINEQNNNKLYANMYINNTGTPRKERLVSKESEVLCGSDKGLMHKISA